MTYTWVLWASRSFIQLIFCGKRSHVTWHRYYPKSILRHVFRRAQRISRQCVSNTHTGWICSSQVEVIISCKQQGFIKECKRPLQKSWLAVCIHNDSRDVCQRMHRTSKMQFMRSKVLTNINNESRSWRKRPMTNSGRRVAILLMCSGSKLLHIIQICLKTETLGTCSDWSLLFKCFDLYYGRKILLYQND